MDTSRAKENAAILFQYLEETDTLPLTSSIFKEDKLKTMGYLGRAWEVIVDYLTGGSASRKRIDIVNRLVEQTLATLNENTLKQFDVRTGFMRSYKKQLGDLAEKISLSSEFNKNDVINNLARSIVRKDLAV